MTKYFCVVDTEDEKCLGVDCFDDPETRGDK